MVQTNNGSGTAEPCHLLSLSPELRNSIYEFAFTTNRPDVSGCVELADALGPAKDLLLTCRQIYDEAAGLQKRAHCRYWTETHFVQNHFYSHSRMRRLRALDERNVNMIQHLRCIYRIRNHPDRKTHVVTTDYLGQHVWLLRMFTSLLQPIPWAIKLCYVEPGAEVDGARKWRMRLWRCWHARSWAQYSCEEDLVSREELEQQIQHLQERSDAGPHEGLMSYLLSTSNSQKRD